MESSLPKLRVLQYRPKPQHEARIAVDFFGLLKRHIPVRDDGLKTA